MGHGQHSRSGGQGTQAPPQPDLADVWRRLQAWAREEGFSQIGVSDVDLSSAEPGFVAWLEAGFAGRMDYMAAHGLKRLRPAELVPGTVRVITARMDYLPRAVDPSRRLPSSTEASPAEAPLIEAEPGMAVISLYAQGRDYHKVLRRRLARVAERLQAHLGPLGHRAFTDSAPVAEVELAVRSGLGWRGKHTLLLHREGGSMFFLGELFVDLPLPLTEPVSDHCGHCSACLQACPTGAIVAPYRLDARLCISYLTIEEPGPIEPALRTLIGQRLYGCDDCQLVCPWNKYARTSPLPDFQARAVWREPQVLELWTWTRADFERHTEGSAIRRIGWERWRRNLAVVTGNALRQRSAQGTESAHDWCTQALSALQRALRAARDPSGEDASPLVAEHLEWALKQAG